MVSTIISEKLATSTLDSIWLVVRQRLWNCRSVEVVTDIGLRASTVVVAAGGIAVAVAVAWATLIGVGVGVGIKVGTLSRKYVASVLTVNFAAYQLMK